MEERTRFVLEYERGLHGMSELWRIYGIARETGYYWMRRFRSGGVWALAELAGTRGGHGTSHLQQLERLRQQAGGN